MFYHISNTSNKESILKNGLEGGRNLSKVYLARSFFDAFFLAPPTVAYMYKWSLAKKLTNLSASYLNDWHEMTFEISLFSLCDNDVSVREHEQHTLKTLCTVYGIPYNENWENRALTEYLSDEDIKPEKITHLGDYKIILYCPSKLKESEAAARQKELLMLRKHGYNRKESLEIIKKKYVPESELWLPPNEGFNPTEEHFKPSQDLIESAKAITNADILEAIKSHYFDVIPDIKEMLQTKYGKELRRQYRNNHKNLLYKSKFHGSLHVERVMLLGALIASKEKLSVKETRLLLTACNYHDIGRINDKSDYMHGKRAGDYLLYLPDITNQVYNKAILCAIVAGHSCPDQNIDYFMNHYGVDPEEQDKCKELFYCLKDADNLDRVRMNNLDVSYLRHETSVALAEVAQQLFEMYPTIEVYRFRKKVNVLFSSMTQLQTLPGQETRADT